MRVAGAPISWGVCEVPGWGHQLSPDTVLGAMRRLGLTATELGPEGFLPRKPGSLRELLERHGLSLVGGFVPVVLHDRDRLEAELDAALTQARLLAEAGAEELVLAAATGVEGYDVSPELSSEEWRTLAYAVGRLADAAGDLGLEATLHPHYGTVIEGPGSIDRFCEVSDVPLCLDTGHVLVGGGDPVALCDAVVDRIRHVHLKDVDDGVAKRVREGELDYRDGVATGLYRPLGDGDVDVARIVERLEEAGYDGWYVLEQDLVLAFPDDEESATAAASRSLHFLQDFQDSSRRGRDGVGPSGPTDQPRRR